MRNNKSLIFNYIGITVLIVISIGLYARHSILFFDILFFIPFFYLDKNKEIPFIYRFIFTLIIIYAITYSYEIIFLSNSNKIDYSPHTLKINNVITAWSYFVSISYLIVLIYRKIKISFPETLIKDKTILILFILGLLYIIYTIVNISNYQTFNINSFFNTTLSFYQIFLFSMMINGLLSLLIYKVYSQKKFIRISIIYISSIYILSFLSSYIVIYLAFTGYGVIAEIFPLNIITYLLNVLAIRYSIILAFSYSIWVLIILLFSKISIKYPNILKSLNLTLLLCLTFLITMYLADKIYPFNLGHFN